MPPAPIIRNKIQISNENDTLAPIYKPRYVLEETECFLRDVDKEESFLWFLCTFSIKRAAAVFCGSRRRVLFMLSLCVLSYEFNSALMDALSYSLHFSDYTTASDQSFHFFPDIPQSKWHLLQKRVHKIRAKQTKHHKHYKDPGKFYQHNYPAEFTCPHERRVGGTKGDGGKWLCNPQNIEKASAARLKSQGNGCIVYTSSTITTGFQFEIDLAKIAPSCEIHVFSPKTLDSSAIPSQVNYHPWGFRASSNNDSTDEARFKTIMESAQLLGHEGYTIDLLSLDAQGLEFDIVHDLLLGDYLQNAPIFMQMLIQVHGAPRKAAIFFQSIQDHGYITFHKSPGATGTGTEQDYGFLKLSKSFFNL